MATASLDLVECMRGPAPPRNGQHCWGKDVARRAGECADSAPSASAVYGYVVVTAG